MPSIHPIAALDDNYIWLVAHDRQAVVIDPSESVPVLDFLAVHGLDLAGILITHHHADHVGGVADLQARFPHAKTYAHAKHGVAATHIHDGDVLHVADCSFTVRDTAGHTDTHLSYLLNDGDKIHVFCGDTLFLAGCGRVFTGTMEQLFHSFVLYDGLADSTKNDTKDTANGISADDVIFYPAHEYSLANLAFAAAIEPNNQKVSECIERIKALRAAGKPSLPTSLHNEREINPFVRALRSAFDERTLLHIGTLGEQKGVAVQTDTAFGVFKALRELKNKF
ncbi:MAG: hydroxyacylglutathione hydrolase C-terminal domain-containing protein [Moraxella sp.]|nr:hydroxyacylglutathione hydrolase C-terminal domain-containing protein [Moraxella sp.]